MRQPGGPVFQLVDLPSKVAADQDEPADVAGQPAPPANQSPGKPPPVEIRIGPDGKLILSSEDTKALDLLEDLIAQSASRHKEYEIFHLKYAYPYTVAATLEDFFKQGDNKSRARVPNWMRGIPRRRGRKRPGWRPAVETAKSQVPSRFGHQQHHGRGGRFDPVEDDQGPDCGVR